MFQPGRSIVATGNEDGTIVLIEAAAASEVGRVTRLIGCSHLAFSVDATLLAAAWDDNTVTIYDVSAGGVPTKLREFAFAVPISALAFNPADNRLAVATEAPSITVHDPRSGTELAPFLHPQPARQFAVSADGALIATKCDDGVVRVFASGPAEG